MEEEIKQNNNIPVSQVTPVQPLRFETPTVDTSSFADIPTSVTNSLIGDLDGINAQVTAQENLTQQGGNDISQLIQSLGNEGTDLVNQENAQGVGGLTTEFNTLQQQLLDLNAQASSLNREAQAIPLQIQEQFKNTGATDRGVAPITAGRLRENALRALSIAQQSDIAFAAATGSQIRLQAAKDKAQQIVDIKYAQIEAELKAKMFNYEKNKDLLDRYDKKRSEALGIALKKEETRIADQKEQDKLSEGYLINAIQGKAPQSVITEARKILAEGGSSTDVVEALGRYSLSAMDRLNFDYKSLQMKQLKQDIALGGIEGTDGLPMTEDEADTLVDDIESVKALMNSKQLKKSAGIIFTRSLITTPNRADWLAEIQTMLSSLTLDTFIEAKAKGATFGAMSEGEWLILRQASSDLAAKMVVRRRGARQGQLKRFTGTDEGINLGIQKIYEAQKRNYQKRTGRPYPEITENSIQVDEQGNINVVGVELSNEDFFNNL